MIHEQTHVNKFSLLMKIKFVHAIGFSIFVCISDLFVTSLVSNWCVHLIFLQCIFCCFVAPPPDDGYPPYPTNPQQPPPYPGN